MAGGEGGEKQEQGGRGHPRTQAAQPTSEGATRSANCILTQVWPSPVRAQAQAQRGQDGATSPTGRLVGLGKGKRCSPAP